MESAIGIDIGGTLIKYALVDKNGNLLFNSTHSTDADVSREKVISNLEFCVRQSLAEASRKNTTVIGVGVGIPGVVDEGVVHGAAENLPDWEDLKFEELFSSLIGLPVRIENDANLMGLAEARYGSCSGIDDAVFLTIGTGIGGAMILNGRLYSGYRNRGAELGHMIIRKDGEKCACGASGCFQAHASTSSLVRDYKNILVRERKTLPLKIDGELIVEQYHQNEASAVEAMTIHFDNLATGVASLMNIFAPRKIVIGGGISESGDFYIENVRQRAFKIAMKETSVFTSVERAGLGNRAGVMGAAALVFDSSCETGIRNI
jgi:glucokinase